LKSHRFIIALAAILALIGSYSPKLQLIEGASLDLFYRLLPSAKTSGKVILVGIDQHAIDEIGPWPWSWKRVADMVSSLDQAGVSTIGMMLPLEFSQAHYLDTVTNDEMPKIPAKIQSEISDLLEKINPDTVLSRAFIKSGKIVLSVPYWLGDSSGGGNRKNTNLDWVNKLPAIHSMKRPFSTLASAVYGQSDQSVAIGDTPFSVARDSAIAIGLALSGYEKGQLLSEPLAIQYDNQFLPSFALQVTNHFKNIALNDTEVSLLKGIRAGNGYIKTDARLHFYPRLNQDNSGTLHLPTYSATELFNNKIPRKILRNKIVLVGLNDRQLTKFSHSYGNQMVPPLEWSGHLINSMLEDNAIKTPAWSLALQRVLIVMLALYLIALPWRLRGQVGIGISIVISAILVNTSLISLLVYTVWLPFTLPALFVLLGQLLVFIHHQWVQAFLSLQTETSSAHSELALNLQGQGKLEKALDYFKKCPLDSKNMGNLYNLALEFERRRQFNLAITIYEYLMQTDENYRDIKDRHERHLSVPDQKILSSSNGNHTKTALIVDHPNVAQPIIGRYEIEEVLGQGAMGIVYKGKDPKIGRTVAIKTLALSQEFDSKQIEAVRRRFYREAETAGRLNHPNIVTIYDVGEEHDLAYIAMDYIKGVGLEQHANPEDLLPIKEVFEIGITAAAALDYAHNLDVVHRDVKPGNIIYDKSNSKLKITDFGIACLTDNSRTRTGTILGSPSYMSPEQLEGHDLDGRSDLFSLGVTLYQLFTGHLPFIGESMTALAYKIANSKPTSVRKVRPELPACLTRVLNKALEKKSKQRYQNGEQFIDALQKCKPSR
jgi:CHASE2 domain-containing sensor protein/tRNA A-37 threonylcarbamoyl transferase component Bud32